jgi:hypothetical protein
MGITLALASLQSIHSPIPVFPTTPNSHRQNYDGRVAGTIALRANVSKETDIGVRNLLMPPRSREDQRAKAEPITVL